MINLLQNTSDNLELNTAIIPQRQSESEVLEPELPSMRVVCVACANTRALLFLFDFFAFSVKSVLKPRRLLVKSMRI